MTALMLDWAKLLGALLLVGLLELGLIVGMQIIFKRRHGAGPRALEDQLRPRPRRPAEAGARKRRVDRGLASLHLMLALAALSGCATFGRGPLFNVPPFEKYDNAAVTNASAHAGWSAAVPLGAVVIGGPKVGAWTGVGYCAGAVLFSALVHDRLYGGAAAGSERRTDIATNCIPALAIALWNFLRGPSRSTRGDPNEGPEPEAEPEP